MNAQLQAALNASTSFLSLADDDANLVELYCATRQYTVTDSVASLLSKVQDIAQCSPEQLQVLRIYSNLRNLGADTNVSTILPVARNNLGSLMPALRIPALTYIMLHGQNTLP